MQVRGESSASQPIARLAAMSASNHQSEKTFALSPGVQDRIASAAASESESIDTFLTRLLDEHESDQFWEAVDAVRPADVNRAVVDADFSLEDAETGMNP